MAVESTKRESILKEASKAFSRFGFKKASIDQIAKMAGVAKGTIYLACKSKQDLFYQVLHREVCAWLNENSKMLDPRVPADELMDRMAVASVAYIDQRPLLKSLLFGEAYAVMPAWANRLDELGALGRQNIEQLLRLGIKQKVFKPEIDVEEVARLMLDLQLAFFVLHDRGDPGSPERMAQLARRRATALDLLLNGLRA